MIHPPRLRPGAVVSLVAAAGPLAEGAVARAAERVRALRWEPRIGSGAEERAGYLAGADEVRLRDLQGALDDPGNDAIWLLRGGYGVMRILPALDLAPLAERPRPLIGFSDNTALHLAARRLGVVTFHGPHPAPPDLPAFAVRELRRQLEEPVAAGPLPFPSGGPARAETLVPGSAVGRLVGGNLSLLAATVGAPWQLDARDAILFLEEVAEPAYRVDRLLTQLLTAGVLDGVRGIAVGAFSEGPDEGRDDLPTTREILLDRLGSLGVPLADGYPFGHIAESWTLPVGVLARLDADAGTLEMLEPGVT